MTTIAEATTDYSFFSVQPSTARKADLTRVLKHGETFAVFDNYGNIVPKGSTEQGIYFEGTRFLSRLEFLLYNSLPLLLNSIVKEDNGTLAVDLSNPPLYQHDQVAVPGSVLHIFCSRLLWKGNCSSQLRFSNFFLFPLQIEYDLMFDADFADIFEVRGLVRPRRGNLLENIVRQDRVIMAYEGLDHVVRRTIIQFWPPPQALKSHRAHFTFTLDPGQTMTFYNTVTCVLDDASAQSIQYAEGLQQICGELQQFDAHVCRVSTSSPVFNEWLNRSHTDIFILISQTAHGSYPYAGIPWFSTVFGRDALITAMEMLWLDPTLARGVLSYLAANQARSLNPEQDAEPGKILHEQRRGEMAALNEVPFGSYYGSIDSTPLFIVLAAAYYDWTGDLELIEKIWPNIELALKWMELHGDMDGDGFIEYCKHSENGLVQQGWKDSNDSISGADGKLAEPPIALCEVQGYAYEAFRGAAQLASALRRPEIAKHLMKKARYLKESFQKAFWCGDLGTYAMALDGQKRRCKVLSSNAGHALFTGIASPRHARILMDTLLSEPMFSGWGIRTLGANASRYNPMSYHNGSVWPHDNALIAAGFARYGSATGALKIMNGLFDLSQEVDQHRLPELLCGFHRRAGEGPVLYPFACSPQAWAAATVYILLGSCLRLKVHAKESKVTLQRPILPEYLQEVQMDNLRVGDKTIDLSFYRHGEDVGFSVRRKDDDIEVMIVK